ncbi:hypothetical protein BX659_1472 [Orenia metallireducens]|uniref:Uncharacterized protein n=1 Tax=Orenia metallireducens TaxID=1413210 RepID=A0A285IHB4_9FIRM|nr:hypothetical protein [Orenia metallireducens]PRX17816.1 hypothetical protein BX659_1472 [Orenia metallireducens]SNY47177.1 hypothetical protein SAMN06265827_1482 [Orenia metallireducens]
MVLNNLSQKELKNLTENQVIKLLKDEWKKTIDNFKRYRSCSIKNPTEKGAISIEILKAYALESTSVELFSQNPDKPHKAKVNYEIFESLDMNDEEKFYFYLKVLYIHGYLQRIDPVNIDEIDIDGEGDYSNHIMLKTMPLHHKLKYLFVYHKELFNSAVLCEKDDEELLINNFLIFEKEDSAEIIYNKMIEFGSLMEIVCSGDGMASLSNKGMNSININLLEENKQLMNDLKETKKEQEKSKENFKTIYKNIKEEFKNHKNKIDSFYKDIVTILSILVGAFSVIGVNINTIPKIDGSFSKNIIILNFSLIFVISVMFYIIKRLIFNFPGEKFEEDRYWMSLFLVIIFIILIVYFKEDIVKYLSQIGNVLHQIT